MEVQGFVLLVASMLTIGGAQTPVPKHGFDMSVCLTLTEAPNKPPTPILVNSFEVHVEFAVENKKYIGEAHEFFDQDVNRGLIKQKINGVKQYGYYFYKTNEYLMIDPVSKQCITENLSQSSHTFLLGYNKTTGMMFTAAGAFRFSQNSKQVYSGRNVTRGIPTDQWTSCHYDRSLDTTYQLEWYFTAYGQWDSASAYPQAPVRAHVKGITWHGSQSHTYDHYYDFFHYRPYIYDQTVFDTPAGVDCIGRANSKPLPAIAPAFSMTSETVDKNGFTVSYMKEHFDQKLKIVKYSYVPLASEAAPFGYNHLTEVHDFNTGVRYVIDDVRGNCTPTAIPTKGFDVAKAKSGSFVRIRSSQEFFYFNNNTPYNYEGIRTVRGIDCDTWIAPSYTLSPGTLVNWEWYFATHTWVGDGTVQFNVPIPIQMRLTIPIINAEYEYNIFHFDRERPDVLKYDVSACYTKSNSTALRFRLSNSYQHAINANKELFRYFTLQSVVGYAKVSPLRVSNIQVVYTTTEIVVSLAILDVAPKVTTDVSNPIWETPLANATAVLVNAINNKEFIIIMDDDTFADPVKLLAYGAEYVNHVSAPIFQLASTYTASDDSGYTGGIMAAVGLPLGVFGAAAGIVLTYLFFK